MTNAKSSTHEPLPTLMAALVATQVKGFGAARKLLNNTYNERPGRPYSVENRDRLLESFAQAEKAASEYGNVIRAHLRLLERVKSEALAEYSQLEAPK